MRDRKADHCPNCGSKFKIDQNSRKRVCSGTWYTQTCSKCGLQRDAFYPLVVKRG